MSLNSKDRPEEKLQVLPGHIPYTPFLLILSREYLGRKGTLVSQKITESPSSPD